MASVPQPDSSASFWHTEPSEFLTGHRTTPELPSQADIVIIGSGVTGASVARYFAEDARAEHLSVVMLEAREACWGATGRNGGHCQALLLERGPDVSAFEVRNVGTVASYIDKNEVPCEWRSLTSCRAFYTETLAQEAKLKVQAFKNTSADLGDRISFVEDERSLTEHHVAKANGAMLTAAAASLWPYKLVAFILEKSIRAGRLNLQTKTSVERVSSVTEIVNDKTFRHKVITPRGPILARHIILATNGYTSHLLPEFTDLIVPNRLHMSALLPPVGMKRLENSYGLVGYQGASAEWDDYLIQRPFAAVRYNDYLNQRPFANVPNPSGHLMFGGGKAAATLESIGVTDDLTVDPGCAAYLKRTLLETMNLGGQTEGLKELEAAKIWSGIIGSSKDRHPWVGAVPDRPGVWLSGGYSGHGMPNATLCGKAVVEMVLGEESHAPLDYVTERLIRTGNLPQSYLISKERIEHCKTLASVKDQDLQHELEAKEKHANAFF